MVITMGWDRLSIVLAVLVGATVLAFNGKVESGAVLGLYGTVVGYVFGRVPSMGHDQRARDRQANGGSK